MFNRKKSKQEDSKKTNEKLAKQLLGKGPKRKTYGFPCRPDIRPRINMLAEKLNVPGYAVAEHAMELSVGLFERMAENPKESEVLRGHLTEVHVGARTIEKISAYDQDTAKKLEQDRIWWVQIESAVRDLVVYFIRRGLKPKDIRWWVDYGIRCKAASLQGRPIPKDWPPKD